MAARAIMPHRSELNYVSHQRSHSWSKHTFAATNAYADEPMQTEENKATVVAFYNKALNDKDVEAAIALMGPTYTQHNAYISDGKEGFRQFFAVFNQKYPHSHSSIVRV